MARVAEKQLGLDLPADSPRLFAGAIPPNEEKIRALKCAGHLLLGLLSESFEARLNRQIGKFRTLLPSLSGR